MNSFAEAKNLSDALPMLDQTGYGAKIREAGESKEALENALNHGFRRAFDEVVSMIPDDDAKDVKSIFMREWDVQNIKSIVCRIHAQTPAGIALMLPSGLMPPKVLLEVNEGRSMVDLYSKLPSEYKSLLKKSFEEYEKKENLFSFENQVDRSLLTLLLSEVVGESKDYVKLKVDAVNIMIALKCRDSKENAGEYFIWDGFHLNVRRLRMMADKSASIKDVLSGTPYVKALESAEHAVVESALKNAVVGEIKRIAIQKPLGVHSVIRFINLKMREYSCVRALVLGKHAGLSASDIKSMITWIQSA
jgi:vacuolar-type H+-ATPase subunit C/Vma6